MNDRFADRCVAGGFGLWRFKALALMLLAGLTGAPSLLAFDEFSYDLRLARTLCEFEMFDYATRQVDGMKAHYPKRRDEISLEQARVLFLNGKAAQAEAQLDGIKPGSSAYNDSRLLLAEMAVRRGNTAQAKKAYAEYFAKNNALVSGDDDAVEAFKKAVSGYAGILTQEGDGAGAAKVMDYLAKLPGEEGGMDERQIRFLKQQRILAAVDQQIQAGKQPNPAVIQAALAELDGPTGLTWGRVDGLYAAALLETAHAQLLLNNPDKAIDKLKNGAEVLNAIEEEIKQESKTLDDSPMAGALYYYGAAQAALAAKIQGTDKASAEKLLIQALKRLQKVRQQYAGSPYASKATLQLAQVKQVLEKDFGRKITLGGEDAEVALRMQKADVLYRAGRQPEALPLYLEAAVGARGSRNFPEIAQRLIDCYFAAGKYLEAEAVASYVAEAYPADPAAAETLLRLGGLFYKKAKEVGEKDKVAAAQLNASAMEWWDLFVDLAPAGTASAPDVAFMVAEDDYGKAVAAAAKTKEMPDGKDKEAAKAAARALYLEAVPKYERLIAKFPAHERGVRALYKLGWIYYSAADQEDPALKKERAFKAAAAFQKYAAMEANTKLNDDVLEAKFRAGELLMLNGAAPEAITQFSELVDWLKPGNTREFDLNAAVTKRIREDAMVFLGWAYDYAGEASRPELEAIGVRIDTAKRTIKTAETTRENGQAAMKAAEAEKSRARAEFAEDEANLRASIGGTIVKTASQLDQGGAGDDQAQKALTAANDRERQKKLNAALLKSTRESLDGERSDLLRLRSVTQAARTTAGDRQAAAETKQQALNGDLRKLAAQKERFTADLARMKTRLNAARQAADATAVEVKNQQSALAAAKTAQKQARAAADKRRTEEARTKAARALQAATQAARTAQQELDEVAGQHQAQLTQSWTNSLAAVSKQLLERQAEQVAAERDLKLGAAESALQDARMRRVALAVKRNALAAKLLEDGGVEALNKSAERQSAVDAEVAALRDETDRRIAKADLLIALAKDDLAAVAAAVAAAKADLQTAEADQAPLLAKIGEFRKLARAQFERYLAQFPQGRHAPDAMARIGTILLDERQFDAAAAVLNDLAGKYPNSKAVSRANFNLGRARMEINQPEEAAKAFERVLAQAATQPVGNLDYIADKMLAAGKPKLAMAAALEMKRRGEDPKNPDYERLRPIRDGILLRAGSAALQSQRYADAIAALDTLLREKPNTFYFFDAKFQLAQARRFSQPPDYEGALRDLSDVLQVAVNDPVMTNRALVAMGEILVLTPTRDSLQQAASRYQQVVLLADPAVAANRPLLEQAVAESAKLFSRLGDPVNRDKMVRKYQETWPGGRFIAEMSKLPPTDFPPPPPPTATK